MSYAKSFSMIDVPSWIWYLFTAIFGALVGSFLNVCIVRIPKGESVVSPRSHCVHCAHRLVWWENIPLVSYGFLRGKCRYCGRAISLRYPIVELATAFFSAMTWWKFEAFFPYLIYFLLFISPLLVVVFIDIAHYIIPNSISLPGIGVGLVTKILFVWPSDRFSSFLDGVIGACIGGGALAGIAWIYERIKKQEGLGGGDIKLMAMLGAFFGWQAALFIMMMSSLLGSFIGVILIVGMKKKLTYAIPFGPFLVFGGIFYFFFGTEIVTWYLQLFLPR